MKRLTILWMKDKAPVEVGEIAISGDTSVFQWNSEFLGSQIELSPIRFKKASAQVVVPFEPFSGLPGMLADHLPDGWGRTLLRHRLIRAGHNFDDLTPLEYLAAVGHRGMGALAFRPSVGSHEDWKKGPLDLDKLQLGVGPILAGTPSDVLEEYIAAGASPNGMRPKIIAKQIGKNFAIGDEETVAPEWLIKFRAPHDSPDSGRIEYAYALMAKKAGLNISESKLIETKSDAFFVTKRFDRMDNGERIHMHTLSGILHSSPMNYTIGYDHMAKVAMVLTHDQRSVVDVFRIAAFNVLAKNQDDHSRNVAFLMDMHGKWSVSPAYDLTFHQNRNDEHKMSIAGKGRADIETLRKFAKDLGIRRPVVEETLSQISEAVSGFKTIAKKLGISKRETERIAHGIGSLAEHKPVQVRKKIKVEPSKIKRR